jgi:hypothetical protein
VSASISAEGVVSPISILSEAGLNCSFLSPFLGQGTPQVQEVPSGSSIPVYAVQSAPVPGVYVFGTVPGMAYLVSQPSGMAHSFSDAG